MERITTEEGARYRVTRPDWAELGREVRWALSLAVALAAWATLLLLLLPVAVDR